MSSSETATIVLPSFLEVRTSGFADRMKGLRVATTGNDTISILVVVRYAGFFVIAYATYRPHLNEEFPGVDNYEYFGLSTDYTGGPNVTGRRSTILLVGNFDGTNVSITPTQVISLPEDAQSQSSLVDVAAGSTHSVVLGRLQTLLLASESDLTGTRIVSDRPLTVLTGHECAQIPSNQGFCEPIYVHMPPTLNWGQMFLLAPFAGRTGS